MNIWRFFQMIWVKWSFHMTLRDFRTAPMKVTIFPGTRSDVIIPGSPLVIFVIWWCKFGDTVFVFVLFFLEFPCVLRSVTVNLSNGFATFAINTEMPGSFNTYLSQLHSQKFTISMIFIFAIKQKKSWFASMRSCSGNPGMVWWEYLPYTGG